MTTKRTRDTRTGVGAWGRERYMSGLAIDAEPFKMQAIPATSLGQSCPSEYPQPQSGNQAEIEPEEHNILGAPLSIRDVARMIGCSAWTVRQRHLRAGLPYFRSGPNGKLVFFRDQVVAWVLEQQKKGGIS